MRLLILFSLISLLPFPCAFANNLQLAQPRLLNQTSLAVTISWDNSWLLASNQPPANHDAVWLFLKYQTSQGDWKHVDLSTLDGDFGIMGNVLEIKAVSDGKGIFVKRAMMGAGTISPTVIQLAFATPLPPSFQDLKVFGIEMVHIPEGPFWLGDSAQFNHFRKGDSAGPFPVTSTLQIPVGTTSGTLYNGGDAPPAADIPAAYPNGYDGFYLMKYELGQAQYVDFLNCLTYPQQAAHTAKSPNSPVGTFALANLPTNPQRNGIVIAQSGIVGVKPARFACDASGDGRHYRADDGQTRACSFLNWQDLLAYLDWAALRPITELEFEKACRGPEYPVPRGFAWGTANVIDANTIVQDGTENEGVTETATATAGLASHGYSGLDGPLRAGFGGHATSNRLQIGGSYYGVLELSGNVWELCVNVTLEGLNYDGKLGDGTLDITGQADVANWPISAGGGHRGGALFSGIVGEFRDLAISDRFYAELHPGLRRHTTGGRGGR